MNYALAKRLNTKHKAALTRAQNSGDPAKVIAAVDAFYEEFRANDLPLPDAWRIWDNARNTAFFEQRMAER